MECRVVARSDDDRCENRSEKELEDMMAAKYAFLELLFNQDTSSICTFLDRDVSEVVPGIRCNNSSSFGITAPSAPITTGTTVTFTIQAPSSSSLSPGYFSSFLCSFFLMLPSLGIATITTTAFICPLSTTTMSGWFAIAIRPVCIWKSHRIFARSFSTTFGGVSHLDLGVLESLGSVLDSAPPGDSVILLGDFNAHVGNASDTWRGVIGKNGPADLNPSGVQFLDFCASHSWSITNTMFEHKGVHQCSWHSSIPPSHPPSRRQRLRMLEGILLSPWQRSPRWLAASMVARRREWMRSVLTI
uniref:Endonuclease/exonuclease/phosphatase domain-containing protein n=1 Tax=Knipowitschia caucasica TaxID=637954 RepID=A0AAV2LMA5_KNICA